VTAIPTESAKSLIGSDIGGTFTDFAAWNEATGRLVIEKTLTTTGNAEEGVFNGFNRLIEHSGIDFSKAHRILHGTTLAINAIIERTGGPTALITTKGFRDTLEIRHTARGDLWDMTGALPKAIVPRELRFEVSERTLADGSVYTALEEAEVRDILDLCKHRGVRSVAVCFLHSYANPHHEQEVRRIAKEHGVDLEFSLSSEVLPEIREYERTSATVINAYVRPRMRDYLPAIQGWLRQRGFCKEMLVMLSEGSVVGTQTALRFPIRMIESGPAAGVIAANHFAATAGFDRVVAFDMGGTTAKSCLLEGGVIPITSQLEVAREYRFRPGSGHPVGTPSVDISEIGSGGGSIASINAVGVVQIGPESAGAAPGPACYALGGTDPTVTDADVLLGLIDPQRFLGGRMPLDPSLAEMAIRDKIATPLKISVNDAALLIRELSIESTANAIRLQAALSGADLRRYVLVAYGGAGPLRAYDVMRKLNIGSAMIPPYPGVFSAFGLLVTPVAFSQTQTVYLTLVRASAPRLIEVLEELQKGALAEIAHVADLGAVRFEHVLDLCYRGQGYTISIAIDRSELSDDIEAIHRRFEAAYRSTYGLTLDDAVVLVTRVRVSAIADVESAVLRGYDGKDERRGLRAILTRRVWDSEERAKVEAEVYMRQQLPSGTRIQGPLIVQEDESSTYVGPKAALSVHDTGSLIIHNSALSVGD